jgi:hypothetical protein
MNSTNHLNYLPFFLLVGFGVALLVSILFGISTPGLIISLFLLNSAVAISILSILVIPILLVFALIKPDWFDLQDRKSAITKFGFIWLAGGALNCLVFYYLGSLTLLVTPTLAGYLMLASLAIAYLIILLNWI